MSLLAASAIIGGGLNLIKGVIGGVQAARGVKATNRLMQNQPVYKRPEEYAQELAMRQKAMSEQLPGYGIYKENIGQATSQALSAAEKGAISSNVYGKQVGDIYQKNLNALRDLTVQSAQFQQGQKENYMRTLQQGAGYSDQEFQFNKLQPWEIQMNMAQSQKQTGTQNLFGGMEGMASTLSSFAGTKYYSDIMKGLMGGKNAVTPTPQQSQYNNVLPWQDYNKPRPI